MNGRFRFPLPGPAFPQFAPAHLNNFLMANPQILRIP